MPDGYDAVDYHNTRRGLADTKYVDSLKAKIDEIDREIKTLREMIARRDKKIARLERKVLK